MNKIVGDRDFIQKLEGGAKHVEIFDADGKLLGRYLPQVEYNKLLEEMDRAPEYNEEIRRQALRGLPGRTRSDDGRTQKRASKRSGDLLNNVLE